MSTTDALSDPLAAALGAVLTVPVVELYAVLWRVGVVEILASRRSPGRMPATSAAATLLSA
ncbi:MAG: Rv1535 domain-containing protein [Mycobacterium sp.]|uniref:Rv1535 domain-containing protein n=1 Tax=Mycobacterium sp. TaxID=1785 RepID=UPI003CC5CD98